jgi:hypothetical protein
MNRKALIVDLINYYRPEISMSILKKAQNHPPSTVASHTENEIEQRTQSKLY